MLGTQLDIKIKAIPLTRFIQNINDAISMNREEIPFEFNLDRIGNSNYITKVGNGIILYVDIYRTNAVYDFRVFDNKIVTMNSVDYHCTCLYNDIANSESINLMTLMKIPKYSLILESVEVV